jgi:taurine transport system ATP-binding protein
VQEIAIDRVSMVYAASDGSAVHALDNVSLTLAAGEIVTILGPSGCGKTTLLNIVGGFLRPTSGEVRVGSTPVSGPGPQRGMVFQQGALFEWLTVAGNISFGPRMAHAPRAEVAAKVAQLLRTVGLEGFGDRPVYQLSGGMQQRVALARCLANEPEVILMDEPLGALDALTREKMQGLILRLWREFGKTIVFITHSVEEALFLGERVVVMAPRPGRILRELRLPFAERGLGADARAIKSSPEFIAAREEILTAIWDMEDDLEEAAR